MQYKLSTVSILECAKHMLFVDSNIINKQPQIFVCVCLSVCVCGYVGMWAFRLVKKSKKSRSFEYLVYHAWSHSLLQIWSLLANNLPFKYML